MEFIESPLFTKLINDYINDTEYAAMQIELASRPDAGSIIPGSGGIRKYDGQAKEKENVEV